MRGNEAFKSLGSSSILLGNRTEMSICALAVSALFPVKNVAGMFPLFCKVVIVRVFPVLCISGVDIESACDIMEL